MTRFLPLLCCLILALPAYVAHAQIPSACEGALRPSDQSKPITVYRGISVDPADFRPLVREAAEREGARFLKNGVTWVTKDLSTAVNYLRLGVPGGPR